MHGADLSQLFEGLSN